MLPRFEPLVHNALPLAIGGCCVCCPKQRTRGRRTAGSKSGMVQPVLWRPRHLWLFTFHAGARRQIWKWSRTVYDIVLSKPQVGRALIWRQGRKGSYGGGSRRLRFSMQSAQGPRAVTFPVGRRQPSGIFSLIQHSQYKRSETSKFKPVYPLEKQARGRRGPIRSGRG